MQVGRISNAAVTANTLKTTCVNKPCKNDLQSQPMNDTFVSSKGKNVSFGSGDGAVAGMGIGTLAGWAIVGALTGGMGLVAAGALMTAGGIAGAAGGTVLGDKITGKDKK